MEISTAFLKSRIDRGTANELEENDAQRPQVYLPRTWVMLMVGDYKSPDMIGPELSFISTEGKNY